MAKRLARVVDMLGPRTEAAAIAQLTTQQLHNITTGRSWPSAEAVARLASAAGADLNWVLLGTGRSAGPQQSRTIPEETLRVLLWANRNITGVALDLEPDPERLELRPGPTLRALWSARTGDR